VVGVSLNKTPFRIGWVVFVEQVSVFTFRSFVLLGDR
jgi:hypothetical protein